MRSRRSPCACRAAAVPRRSQRRGPRLTPRGRRPSTRCARTSASTRCTATIRPSAVRTPTTRRPSSTSRRRGSSPRSARSTWPSPDRARRTSPRRRRSSTSGARRSTSSSPARARRTSPRPRRGSGRRGAGSRSLRQQLADADLVAPLDAVVRSRLMEPGEMASPQKPGLLAGDHRPEVGARLRLRARPRRRCSPGMAATVDGRRRSRADASTGWVGFISPVAEFTPKTVQTDGAAHQPRLRGARVRRRPRRRAAARHAGDRPTPSTRRRREARRDDRRRPRAGPIVGAAGVAQDVSPRERRDASRALDGRVAVRGAPATLTALVGPDGAGKTTLHPPDRRAADAPTPASLTCSASTSARDPQAVQDRIGYMPQRFGLYEDLTRPGEPRPLRRSARRDRGRARASAIRELMEMTALGAVHRRAWPAGSRAA